MELIKQSDYLQLVQYLPRVKENVAEWQLIDVHLKGAAEEGFTADAAANQLLALFTGYEGRVYVCNNRTLLSIMRWPSAKGQAALIHTIQTQLPPKSCEVLVHAPDAAGLKKLEIRLFPQQLQDAYLAHVNANRVLVADDDAYVRMLVKKGIGPSFAVQEVTDGDAVVNAYGQYRPHILFLDIHLPGRDGTEILKDIIALDKDAYIVMLSADSSPANVQKTIRLGAKTFLTKPFTKEKLQEVVAKCPTIHRVIAPR